MFLVIIPLRQHPIPFRTRKLSSYGPMVLAPQGAGRVGHRQIPFYRSRYMLIVCLLLIFYTKNLFTLMSKLKILLK